MEVSWLIVVLLGILSCLIARGNKSNARHESKKSRKNSKNSSKLDTIALKSSKRRKVIVPTRKVSLNEKAASSFDFIKKSLTTTASQALAASSKLSRKLKYHFSSDFESLLLKMTLPNDAIIDDRDLGRYSATIDSFARNMDVTSKSNPYRVTLRKLWSKQVERDGRSVIKATYLLHFLLRNTAPEDCVIFKRLMTKMARERNQKSKSYYFDIEVIKKTFKDQDYLQDFIGRYGTYVLKRSRAFTSSFEEMKLISIGMKKEDICAQFLKAAKLIVCALQCRVRGLEESSVTVMCTELLARDLFDLFSLYHDKLKWLVDENDIGDVFDGWSPEDVQLALNHFKSFYNENYETVQSFLTETNDLLELYGLQTLSTTLDAPLIFREDICDVANDVKEPSFKLSDYESSSYDSNVDYMNKTRGTSAKKAARMRTKRIRKK